MVHDGDPGGCKAGLVLVTPRAAKAVALLFPEVARVSMSVASHIVLTWNKQAKLCWGNWNRWKKCLQGQAMKKVRPSFP